MLYFKVILLANVTLASLFALAEKDKDGKKPYQILLCCSGALFIAAWVAEQIMATI